MEQLQNTQRITQNLTFRLSGLTLAIEEYLTDCRVRNLAPGTIKRYNDVLCHFAGYLPGIELDSITASDIRHYLAHLEDTGHNPGGIALHYRHLKAFFKWLWREDILTVDLFKRIKTPRNKTEPLPPAELADINKLIAAAAGSNFTAVRDRAIFLFLLDSGVRAKELCNLNIGDIDITSGAVHLRAEICKSGKPRTTFASPKTRRAILAHWRKRSDRTPDAPLFSTTAGRLTFWGLRSVVERRAQLAGITSLPLHSFRRAFAVNAIRNGIDLSRLKDLMGHSSIVTTQKYLKFATEDLQAAHEQAAPVSRLKGGKR